MSVQKHVLVVDDHEGAAELLAALLRIAPAPSYSAEAVASVDAALASVAERKPDAVVMDIEMPRVDGYTGARMMRSLLGPAVFLIAMSSSGEHVARVQAGGTGFDDAIAKPLDIDSLLRNLDGGRARHRSTE